MQNLRKICFWKWTLFLRLFCISLQKSHVNTLNINSSVLKWKNVEIFIYILKSFGPTSAICGSDTWEVGRIKKQEYAGSCKIFKDWEQKTYQNL